MGMRNRLSSDPQLAQPKDLPRVRGHIAPEALKAPGTSAGCNALGLGSCLFWSNFRLRFHLWTYVWPVVAVDVFNPSPKSKGGPGVVFPPKQICRFGPYHDWRSSTEGLRGSIDAHHPILATYHARNHVFPLFMALLIPWVIAEATDTMPKSASFAVDSQHQTRYV